VRGARQWLGVLAAIALGLVASGCAAPSWVPFLGKEKPPPTMTMRPPSDVVKAESDDAAEAKRAEEAKRNPVVDSGDVMDRVVCVVNNDAITLFELEEVEAQYLYENKEEAPEGSARKALSERLLKRIIDSRIQLQQAEREKVTVDDAEITEQIEEIMKKVNAKTLADFEEVLKSQGLTLDAVKKRIREQIMVQRLTRRKVALRVSVTEQEIDRYLDENRDKLEVGLSFEARHILFLPAPPQGEAEWEAAGRKAEEVYTLLNKGQDFSELAQKYSEDASGKDGGSLGTLKRGELAPDIETAILQLQPGRYSAPFRSKVGYHLFRLDSKESLSGETLAQSRNQIRDILYRQKYESRMQEWLTEIRQRAVIDIRM
jgi:peptidyl-prolyl cis-trans isomerase SurA